VTIDYKGTKVGRYRMDLLVEEKVIVELKTVKRVTTADCRRLLSYLKATNKKVGLLVNFAKPIVEIKRSVL
jgi:GxxExxY protein